MVDWAINYLSSASVCLWQSDKQADSYRTRNRWKSVNLFQCFSLVENWVWMLMFIHLFGLVWFVTLSWPTLWQIFQVFFPHWQWFDCCDILICAFFHFSLFLAVGCSIWRENTHCSLVWFALNLADLCWSTPEGRPGDFWCLPLSGISGLPVWSHFSIIISSCSSACLVLLLFLSYPFLLLVHSPNLFFPKPPFSKR